MTDQTASDDALVPAAEGEASSDAHMKSGKLPGKKLVLFFIAPILLLAMTGAGIYFSGLADSFLGGGEAEEELLAEAQHGPSVYYDLPEMLVNLNTSGRKTGYLKISVSLELASEKDIEHLQGVMPRIVDNFQVYLREMRVEDLQGSAGLQRLREELLLRVSNAARPAVVRDVLFREMLIQKRAEPWPTRTSRPARRAPSTKRP